MRRTIRPIPDDPYVWKRELRGCEAFVADMALVPADKRTPWSESMLAYYKKRLLDLRENEPPKRVLARRKRKR